VIDNVDIRCDVSSIW